MNHGAHKMLAPARAFLIKLVFLLASTVHNRNSYKRKSFLFISHIMLLNLLSASFSCSHLPAFDVISTGSRLLISFSCLSTVRDRLRLRRRWGHRWNDLPLGTRKPFDLLPSRKSRKPNCEISFLMQIFRRSLLFDRWTGVHLSFSICFLFSDLFTVTFARKEINEKGLETETKRLSLTLNFLI